MTLSSRQWFRIRTQLRPTSLLFRSWRLLTHWRVKCFYNTITARPLTLNTSRWDNFLHHTLSWKYADCKSCKSDVRAYAKYCITIPLPEGEPIRQGCSRIPSVICLLRQDLNNPTPALPGHPTSHVQTYVTDVYYEFGCHQGHTGV